MTIRVVLDTNVVLSALLFEGGRLAWIRREWMGGGIRPVVCRETTEELIRALAYPKFRLDRDDREELLGDYLPYVEAVENVEGVGKLPRCADPADQVFLQLAEAAGVDFLVTGDRALLGLKGKVRFGILSLAELEEEMGKKVKG